MRTRNLVIGGLLAGAFLLPSLASAGKVTGVCVNCHTMHNSQNNASMNGTGTPNNSLLSASNCAGCHAQGAANNASGVGGTKAAPQVDDATNVLSGGYFTKNGTSSALQHNVSDIAAIGQDAVLALNTPGGVARGTQLGCADCHNGSGGHHGTGGGFRLLGAAVTGTPAANYGVQAATVGNRSEATYTDTMDGKCATCHPNFHGNAVGGNQQSAVAGVWVRHPTGISMTGAGNSIVQTYNQTNDTDFNPVGTDGSATNVVLCLSCHVPHGSANSDLLAFAYSGSGNFAGDDLNATLLGGCETCHTYGALGM